MNSGYKNIVAWLPVAIQTFKLLTHFPPILQSSVLWNSDSLIHSPVDHTE